MTNPLVDPLVGRTVAHYEILARLGGGGMGVVYKARDTRLGRTLALKFLPQQWSQDEGAKQRFVREAQAASATDHPNICTIHDIETADDGQLFIVMAYYEGQTLKQRLEQGPLPIDEALDIATQVADGLAKAHGQGVVHRDVKPGNLILTEDGIRIVDFGLATFADALQLTVVGSTLGTAAYMSPEQVRGEDVDPRTDVWAVGVVLYQMLTGHVPFRGAYAEAIAYAIRNDVPPPLRGERPEIPEDVEQLVFRALHKDAAVRFASGRELARALRQVRGQTVPVDLRTEVVFTPAMASPAPRRRPVWRFAAAAVAVVMLGGIPGAWWLLRPVDRIPILVAPVANQTGFADVDPYRMALTQAVVDALRSSPRVRVVPFERMLQSLRGLLSDAAVDISSRKALDVLTGATGVKTVILPTLVYDERDRAWRARVEVRNADTAETRTYLSEPRTSSLSKETAHTLMDAVVVLIRRHFGDEDGWTTVFKPNRAYSQLSSPDVLKAFEEGTNWYEEQEYVAAMQSFDAAAKLEPLSPLPHAWRSRAAHLARKDTEAVAAAIEAERRLVGSSGTTERLFVEAVVADARRDRATAEARYRALVDEQPDDVGWKMELAAFEDRRAENRDGWLAAVGAYHDVLKSDPGLIRPHLELCRLYVGVLEPQKAREQGQAALQAYQAVGWRSGEALSRFCLADVLRGGTDDERRQAQQHAEAAARILESGFPYNLPRAIYYLGLAAGEQGRLADAMSFWERALGAAVAGGNLVLRPSILTNLALAHQRLGNPSQAITEYGRSAASYEEIGDERRAARQKCNSANLRIIYGFQVAEAVRDVENALEVVRQRGDAEFEVLCLETQAMHYRHSGRYEDADRALNRASNLAAQLHLEQRQTAVTLETARLLFERSLYAQARTLLLPIAGARSGRAALRAVIMLGRIHTRLGDTAAATENFAAALRELDKRDDAGLRPRLHASLGELAYERGLFDEARRQFEKASSFASDTFVEEAVVEARAYLGLLDGIHGEAARGIAVIEQSLMRAAGMGRVGLQARCRVFLARLHLLERRPEAALRALGDSTPQERDTLGMELRAQLHYWRGRARVDRDAAESDLTIARGLVNELRDSIPEPYRQLFSARRDMRQITGAV